MRSLLRALLLIACVALVVVARAAQDPRPFSQTLSAEQKQRLGLRDLTPAQLADLDAAIGAYTRGETTVAVEQAVRQVEQQTEVKVQQAVQQVQRQSEEKVQQAQKKAAETAVAEYKKKEEPGVIARTLDVFKRRQDEEKRERFTAHVVGEFRGWNGGTYFPLENGQIWRQVGSEMNEQPPVQNAEIEIFKSNNGYWRLKYGGAWITVKRLQ